MDATQFEIELAASQEADQVLLEEIERTCYQAIDDNIDRIADDIIHDALLCKQGVTDEISCSLRVELPSNALFRKKVQELRDSIQEYDTLCNSMKEQVKWRVNQYYTDALSAELVRRGYRPVETNGLLYGCLCHFEDFA